MVVLYGQCSEIACIKRHFSFPGKVLVHCLMGMSRSATLVLAFLIKKETMTVVEAFKQVHGKIKTHNIVNCFIMQILFH